MSHSSVLLEVDSSKNMQTSFTFGILSILDIILSKYMQICPEVMVDILVDDSIDNTYLLFYR